MRTRIVVEDNELDLSEDIELSITKAVDDISSFGSRNSGFTKTVTIPGTAQNNFIFGHLFDVNVFNPHDENQANVGYNYNANRTAFCRIYIDGMQVMKGVVRVMEIIVKGSSITYEVSIVGELGGFIAAMGDRELKELDFSEWDHTYSLDNVLASWGDLSGSTLVQYGEGWYYPLIDYGSTQNANLFDIEDLRPSLYVRELIAKIIADAGYTFASNFMDSERFRRLIIPDNRDGLYFSPPQAFQGEYIWYTPMAPFDWDYLYVGSNPIKGNANFFEVGDQHLTYDDATGRWTNERAAFSMKLTAKMNFLISSPTSGLIRFSVNKVSAGAESIVLSKNFTPTAGVSFIGEFSGTTSVELLEGDYLTMELKKIGVGTETAQLLEYGMIGEGNPELKIPLRIGDAVSMNTIIPVGVKQRDFFKSITQMFNLIIDEDPTQGKSLTIEPYVDYYNDVSGAVNWTSKIDTDKDIRIVPQGELQANRYEFNYKKDSDYYNEYYTKKTGKVYGNRVFDSGAEFVKKTNKTEVIFSGTPVVNTYGSANRAIPAIIKRDSSNLAIKTESNIRILYRATNVTECDAYTVADSVTGQPDLVTGIGIYNYTGHIDNIEDPLYDLCFGAPEEIYFSHGGSYPSENLFNEFWSSYMAEIVNKDSKVVTAMVSLNAVDMANFNFANYVWLGGQLFRVNKIFEFSPTKFNSTKVEFLNVINLI